METVFILSNILLWLVVLLNLLLTMVLVRQRSQNNHNLSDPQTIGIQLGQVAPNFTVRTLEGEIVQLSDYSGRKVAFLFISTSCAPCREAVAIFAALLPKAAQVGVELVLVSSSETEDTKTFVREFDLHLPVLVAPHFDSSFFKDYEVVGTPSFCVVNEQGKVHGAGHFAMNGGIQKILDDLWMEQVKKRAL